MVGSKGNSSLFPLVKKTKQMGTNFPVKIPNLEEGLWWWEKLRDAHKVGAGWGCLWPGGKEKVAGYL